MIRNLKLEIRNQEMKRPESISSFTLKLLSVTNNSVGTRTAAVGNVGAAIVAHEVRSGPQSVILTLNVAYGVPQTYSKNSNTR